MSIRPTHHRILIQPDEVGPRIEQSAGGIALVTGGANAQVGLVNGELKASDKYGDYVATSGTVVAMGTRGSRVRWDARQRALRDAVDFLRHLIRDDEPSAAKALRAGIDRLVCMIGSPDSVHEVSVGDRVAFDSESGLRLTQDGIEYLILDEDDVVVIVDEKESAA